MLLREAALHRQGLSKAPGSTNLSQPMAQPTGIAYPGGEAACRRAGRFRASLHQRQALRGLGQLAGQGLQAVNLHRLQQVPQHFLYGKFPPGLRLQLARKTRCLVEA